MPKHVLVLGAGIAGLGAAANLVARGFKVTILEAKERLGGRIHTVQSNSLPIELGAEFVHGRNKTLIRALEDAHLTTHDAAEKNRARTPHGVQPLDIWDTFGNIIKRLDPRHPDESFYAFIERQQIDPLQKRMATAFVEGFHAVDPMRVSAQSLRLSEQASEEMEGDFQGRVNEGYSALIYYLANQLRQYHVEIFTRARVRNVRWQRGRVQAIIESGEAFSADAAIITLPLGVLKAGTVQFTPPLYAKREAISGLLFGNVARITFLFRDQWWLERDFGFVHAVDELLPTWWSYPRGALLTGWAGGPKADAILKKPHEELEQLGLDVLERLFGRTDLRSHLVASYMHNWAQDIDVRGAYSYMPVGGIDLPQQLAAPIDDTLFFAGEATVSDAQTGTVFGALESGERAAEEAVALVMGKRAA